MKEKKKSSHTVSDLLAMRFAFFIFHLLTKRKQDFPSLTHQKKTLFFMALCFSYQSVTR